MDLYVSFSSKHIMPNFQQYIELSASSIFSDTNMYMSRKYHLKFWGTWCDTFPIKSVLLFPMFLIQYFWFCRFRCHKPSGDSDFNFEVERQVFSAHSMVQRILVFYLFSGLSLPILFWFNFYAMSYIIMQIIEYMFFGLLCLTHEPIGNVVSQKMYDY